MRTLTDYLEEKVRVIFEKIDDVTARDIYALWLMAALHEDDPRYPELNAFGYSTETYSTPDLIDSYGSRWSPNCIAAYVPLNLCQPEMPQWKQAGDAIGAALRDQLFDAQNTRFDRTDEEDEMLSRHAKLQHRENRGVLELSEAAELEELTIRFDPSGQWSQQIRRDADFFIQQRNSSTQVVFAEALGEVARRLHQKGDVERVCGRPVPIGISFTNDVDERFLAAVVREANPVGLSRGIEEELLGATYEQIEARHLLDDEIAKLPEEDQVAFWVRALYESCEQLYLSRETQLTQKLRDCALLHSPSVLLRLVPYTPLAVPLILSLIEDKVSTAPDVVKDVIRRDEKQVAESMLLYLDILAKRGERDAVAEEDIERIYAILRRLWEESQTLSAPVIGTALQVTARVLHSMRPQRFPVVKFGSSSSNGNRLLNYHEFGLYKNDVPS